MTEKILKHFEEKDPVIYSWLLKIEKPELTAEKPENYFYKLARSVAFQQLHGKAAETIWNRFEKLFPNEEVTPEETLKLSIEQMRSCGFSNNKAQYIKNIAEAFVNKHHDFENLAKMENEEIIKLLTQIKGVGKWTVEMFLMFTLAREDVFSMGDYGLKKGIKVLYRYKKDPAIKTIERITKKWSPYRTYGAMTLWRALDIFNP